jgi:SAM-dependent methyltransferase
MTIRTSLTWVFVGSWSLLGPAIADDPQTSKEDTAIHVPTPPDVVVKMLEVAKVTKQDRLYDLGCGDGRIVIAAAQTVGCRADGYDIDERKVLESRGNAKKAGVEALVHFERHDIFKLDLSKASVVTLYLLPEMHEQLVPQLKQMKSGSRIVTHDFPIPGLRHNQRLTMKSLHDDAPHSIYLYKLPLVAE